MVTRAENPAPLSVASSLVAIQGVVLVGFAVVELLNVRADRAGLAISVAAFFLIYGAVLLVCAVALMRRRGWTRGPVLMTQLIQLGLAWNLRDAGALALTLVVAAVVVLAAMLHPTTLEALTDE